jgi:hypothetical protein
VSVSAAGKLAKAQAAVEKLHSQLQLAGQPHGFLLSQLAAAEAAASQAQQQLEAAQVGSLTRGGNISAAAAHAARGAVHINKHVRQPQLLACLCATTSPADTRVHANSTAHLHTYAMSDRDLHVRRWLWYARLNALSTDFSAAVNLISLLYFPLFLQDALRQRDEQAREAAAERSALRRDLERILRERGTLDSMRRLVGSLVGSPAGTAAAAAGIGAVGAAGQAAGAAG